MSTAYEELRKQIADYLTDNFICSDVTAVPADECFKEADFLLALIFRTLENVTPEMRCAINVRAMPRPTWLAMLKVSPLAPPKEGK